MGGCAALTCARPWVEKEFSIDAFSVRYLNLVHAKDSEIFAAARGKCRSDDKDSDFVLLQERFGPPPSILWIRCGNTSNAHLKNVLQQTFPRAWSLLESGEPLVEITDVP